MKGLGIAAGLMLGVLLTVMGLAMQAPAAPPAYPGPLWGGLFSLVMLPVGYWLGAARILPPLGGGIALAIMVTITLALWVPLIDDPALREAHLYPLVFWSAVWAAAAIPFARLAMKGIRRMRR